MSAPAPDNRNWIDRYLDNLRSLADDAPDDYTTVAGVPIGLNPRKLLDPPGFIGAAAALGTKAIGDPIATPITAPTGMIMRAMSQLPDIAASRLPEGQRRAAFSDKPEIPFAGNDLDPAAYAEYARANLNESLPGQIALGMLTPLSLFGGGFKALGTGLGRAGVQSAIPSLGASSKYGKAAAALIEMDKTYTEGIDLISKGAGNVVKGPVRDFGKKVPLYGAAQEWALAKSPAALRDEYTLNAAEVTNSLGRAVRARGRGLSSADVRTPGAQVVTNLPKGMGAWSVIGNTYTTINTRILNMAPERQARALRVFGDMVDSTNAMQTRSVIERGQLLEEWNTLKPTLSGQDLLDADDAVKARLREIFETQAQAQHKDQLAVLKVFEELDNTPLAKFGAFNPATAATVKQATATAVKAGKDAAIEARRYAAELRGKPRIDPITGLKLTPEPIWRRPNWHENIPALMGEDIPYREARQRAIDAINSAGTASGLGSDDPMTAFARNLHGMHRQGLEGWDVSPITQAQELGLDPTRLGRFDAMLRDPKQFYDRAAREIPMARNSLMRNLEAGITAHMKAAGKTQADIDAVLPRLLRSSNTALSHEAFRTKNRLGIRTLNDAGKKLSAQAGRYDQYGDLLRAEDMDNIIAGRMGEMFHREELGIKPLRRGIVVPGVGMTALDELQKLPGMGRLGAGLDKEWKQEAIGKLHQTFLDQGMTDLQAGAEAARLAADPRQLLAHPAMKQLLFDDLKTGAGLALGSWKEQNLLALSYHAANVTSQAALGTLAHAYGAEDVDPKFWLKLLRQKMTQLVKEGKADNSIPHAVSPDYVMIRGNGTSGQAWAGLADTVGEQAAILGTETASSTGRIPTPIRLALFGGGMAASAHGVAEAAGLSDEDEAKLVGVAGLLGALYGWKVPAGVKGNFLLAGATEKGGRIAAGLTGFESNIGQIERDAITDAVTGTGQKKEFYDAVDTLIANLGGDLQSVGRQVTGPVPLPPGAPRPAPLRPPSPAPAAPAAQPGLAPPPKPATTPPQPVVGPAPAAAPTSAGPTSAAPTIAPEVGPPGATATFNTAEQSLERRIEAMDTYIENVTAQADYPRREDVLDRSIKMRDRLIKQRDAQAAAAPAPAPAPAPEAAPAAPGILTQPEAWTQLDDARVALGEARRALRQAVDGGASDAALTPLREQLNAAQATHDAAFAEASDATRRRPSTTAPAEAIPAAATPADAPITEQVPAAMTPYQRQQELNAIYQQAEEFAAQHPDLAPFDKKIATAEAKYQTALDAQFTYTGEKSLKNNPEYAALNKAQIRARNAVDKAKQARKSAERDLYFAEETRLKAERSDLEGPTAVGQEDLPAEAIDPNAQGMFDEEGLLPDDAPEGPLDLLPEDDLIPDPTPVDIDEMPPPAPEPEAAPPTDLSDLSVPYESQLDRLFDIAVERGRLRNAANPASQDAFNTLQTRADIARSAMVDENRMVPLWFDNPDFEREVAAAVGGLDPAAPNYQAIKQQAIASVMQDFVPYSNKIASGFAHPDNVLTTLLRSVPFTDTATFGDDLLKTADTIGLQLDPHLSATFDRDVQILGYLKQMADDPIDWSMEGRYGLSALPDQRPEMADLLSMTPDQVNQWLPYLGNRDRSRFATLWAGVDETNGRIIADLKQAIIKAQADLGLVRPGATGSGLPPLGAAPAPPVPPAATVPPGAGPPAAAVPPAAVPPTGGGAAGPPAIPPAGPPAGPPAWTWSTPDPAFQIGDLRTSRQLKTARNLAYGDMPNAPDGMDLEDYFDLTASGPKIKIGQRFDSAAFKRAFADANGQMTADQVYDLARSFGASRPQATRLRADWDDKGFAAERAGKANADNIHIDYQDINNLIYYGKMGPFPFLTWQAKAIPKYLQMMAHHPAIPLAINEYTKATDNELEEQGLPKSFRNFAKDGGLISLIAQMAMQREGDVYANALPAFFPYSDVGKEQSDYDTPVDKILHTMQSVGLGPSPLITAPLNMLGLTSDLPVNMLRNSPLLAAGVQALTGHAVDPEALPKQAMRGVRGAINPGSLEKSITGDPIKDYYVRKRISSMAAEKNQKPTGQYLEAIQNGKGPIWDLALRDVEREMGGRAAISWVVPVRTRLMDKGEQVIRDAIAEQGITNLAIEELNRKPLTRQDMQYAAASLGRNPLDMGETLEERAKSLRVSRQYGKARAAAPVTGGLSGLGADPRSEARRAQLLEQETRRTKPLSARARASRERSELSRGEAILREMGQ